MVPEAPHDEKCTAHDYMRYMRYLISRQWSVLQDFDITGEPGDLHYQVRGNFGLTQTTYPATAGSNGRLLSGPGQVK
jgi:hypothetical protein